MMKFFVFFLAFINVAQASDRDHQLYDYWKNNKFHNDENCAVVDDLVYRKLDGSYFGGYFNDFAISGNSEVKKACGNVKTSQSDFNKACFEALDNALMGIKDKVSVSGTLKETTEKDCKLKPTAYCELDEYDSSPMNDDSGDLRAVCRAHLVCNKKVQVFSNDPVTAEGGYTITCLNHFRERCEEKLTLATINDCEPVGKLKRVVPRAASSSGGSSYSGGSGHR